MNTVLNLPCLRQRYPGCRSRKGGSLNNRFWHCDASPQQSLVLFLDRWASKEFLHWPNTNSIRWAFVHWYLLNPTSFGRRNSLQPGDCNLLMLDYMKIYCRILKHNRKKRCTYLKAVYWKPGKNSKQTFPVASLRRVSRSQGFRV